MNITPGVNGPLLAGPYNARLGPEILAFNLPATPEICVGVTDTCAAACYAKSFLFQVQSGSVRAGQLRRLDDRGDPPRHGPGRPRPRPRLGRLLRP